MAKGGGSHKCAVCSSSFGLTLWKYTCSVCQKNVCDDCAPEHSKLRVCSNCRNAGCVPGGGASNNNNKPNSQSEEEREKRLKAIEARMAASQAPQRRAANPPPRPVTVQPAPVAPSSDAQHATTDVAQPMKVTTTTTALTPTTTATPTSSSGGGAGAPSGGAARPSNPMLEAALKRQQQQQQQQGGGGQGMSAEKSRLLREITNILTRVGEEEPFGLRSSDESKLLSYLKYLKEKHAIQQ